MNSQSLKVDDHETAGDEQANAAHDVGGNQDGKGVVNTSVNDEISTECVADCSDSNWRDCVADDELAGRIIADSCTHRPVKAKQR